MGGYYEILCFSSSTKVIFGKGTEELAGKEIKKYSDKVFFYYSGGSIKKG